ncbi:MAG: UDP-N-acetylmuramoylalanyl-D-glutamate--2,6-diaminopimelate ligase [Zetaproteobacteria bacterium CG12_big_fil_rev_8_21_14_0_65_54_13]|nr:MAG: UDP-N-acetylmuramoylalanyl-D-glutamate--2,6-diaminopimelate ligase [Zetaproteobacteria bacterium CG23_combo_of_CG06-09_8_20_14_all_54_7]PIW44025.1 MAG: UDP-N-acetylmuramoylalanyl-D-glutamate--2,6-diaminopimelate ligase [Zetaproteobacteria bacterium CG12_big_fil_rev_8_21_14_0_65_54_13]PIX54358.1 MAG: UDP-N-acetylmuramoylalanyl-D-glutamate--2,6-diaminopimelate ligase [Zetaproteobacteria bacterium CG_4_10_14_3_um_filter_54_28]PJA28561.1 MAG: UDP-N-acetylmuramoylalanyl-D-glutamate--2,6-diami
MTNAQTRSAELESGFSLRALADGLGELKADSDDDVQIMGICDDSRYVKPGYAMMCLPRSRARAAEYAEVASRQGATAIIAVGVAVESDLPVLQLASMQQAGLLLRRLFRTEHARTHFYGITGTDGKTSVAWMLREALTRFQSQPVWSCGTLGWLRSPDDILDIGNTTPSMLTMHAMLSSANLEGVFGVACEISSHGIAQERIAGIDFHTAVWTNMGHDHLQDHGGYSAYLKTKAGFVQATAAHGGNVVANADHADIREHAPEQSCWYGHGLYRDDVDLAWEQELPGLLRLKSGDDEVVIEDIPLGDFHAENVACVALTLMVSMAVPLTDLPQLLGRISAPPGRMQEVTAGYGQVYIDYAHTPEALERCLLAARKLTRGRLSVVFGCGGERDREKRPQMGAIAAELADLVWITSDNPRGEMPAVIASEIEQGMSRPYTAEVKLQLDRGKAIDEAIAALEDGDLLIIAGKGHEAYMEVCGQRLPWSDEAIANTSLHLKHGIPGLDRCA